MELPIYNFTARCRKTMLFKLFSTISYLYHRENIFHCDALHLVPVWSDSISSNHEMYMNFHISPIWSLI